MSFIQTVSLASGLAGLIAAIGSRFGYVVAPYVRKDDLRQQVDALQCQFLFSERRTLTREKYYFESRLKKGVKLDDTEQRHYTHLTHEIAFIDRQLKLLRTS